jgi:hypothetical protein
MTSFESSGIALITGDDSCPSAFWGASFPPKSKSGLVSATTEMGASMLGSGRHSSDFRATKGGDPLSAVERGFISASGRARTGTSFETTRGDISCFGIMERNESLGVSISSMGVGRRGIANSFEPSMARGVAFESVKVSRADPVC